MDDVALAMVERFGMLEDPRAGHAKRHELPDIIVINLYSLPDLAPPLEGISCCDKSAGQMDNVRGTGNRSLCFNLACKL